MRRARNGFAEVVVRPFGAFQDSPPLHFWAVQAVAFLYMGWRFASRDYTVYGRLPSNAFDYARTFVYELWPLPALHFTTFQFIYAFLPRPGPDVIFGIQIVVIAACLAGAVGIAPRVCAALAFLLGAHVTGFLESSNADFDGGTAVLCALLVLSLSPTESFYRLGRSNPLSARDARYQWPLALLMLLVGSFYGLSGLCKLVDIGPHWPFVLHIERLATQRLEDSLFVATRWVSPATCELHLSPTLSVIAGMVTLGCELGALGFLFLPRQRLPVVVGLIGLHTAVFLMAGINFLGNSAILVLCLDWNVLARRLEVTLDPRAPVAAWLARNTAGLDWMHRLSVRSASTDGPSLAARDEHGTSFAGLHALEQVAARCPPLWPLAIALKVPLAATLVGRTFGSRFA